MEFKYCKMYYRFQSFMSITCLNLDKISYSRIRKMSFPDKVLINIYSKIFHWVCGVKSIWVWELVCYTCQRGWRGWRACMGGMLAWVACYAGWCGWRVCVDGMLVWVAWVVCLRGWHATVLAWLAWVDVLTWVTWLTS